MTITADTNPELLNQYAQQAMQSASQPAREDRPHIETPPDTIVTLPGGYLTFPALEVIKEAEVRELNGYDEEKLASVPSNRLLDVILERGTVRIGEDKATPDILNGLLIGDREALLLGIRIATYGKELELERLMCPTCGVEQQVTSLDLSEIVPIKHLEDQADRNFQVILRKGRVATVSLPTGASQRAILTGETKTVAQLNTLLLAQCITAIDGLPTLSGTKIILELSVKDRAKVIKEIGERSIGPRFGR